MRFTQYTFFAFDFCKAPAIPSTSTLGSKLVYKSPGPSTIRSASLMAAMAAGFAAAFGLPVTEGELSPQAVRQLLSDNFNVVVDADETVPLVIEAVGRVFVDKQIGRRKDIIEDELDDEDY